MSSAALAKKRRANMNAVQEVPPPAPAPQQAQRGGMSLPQILSMVEKRILNIEAKIASKDNEKPEENINANENLKIILDEYDSRFEMLATQINDLKDIVMQLQRFTMEVNKSMYEKITNTASEETKESEVTFSQAEST